MSVFNSISVAVLIVLLVAGAFVGLSAASTDLLNPNTSRAEADRVRAKTEHDSVMNKLEEQREQAKTEAEIATIQRQQEAEQKRFEEEMQYIEQHYTQKLTAYESWVKVRNTLLLAFGVSMSSSLFLFVGGKVLVMVRTVPVPSQVFHQPAVAKQDRKQQILIARANERLFRTTALMEGRLNTVSNPAKITKDQRDKLPLAI